MGNILVEQIMSSDNPNGFIEAFQSELKGIGYKITRDNL